MNDLKENPQTVTDRKLENDYNEAHSQDPVAIKIPLEQTEDDNYSELDQAFYFASNVDFMYMNTVHHFDIYFTEKMAVGDPDIVGSDSKTYLANKESLAQGVLRKENLVNQYRASISRMERSAEGDEDTSKAFALLKKMAEEKKRIAFVSTHGGPLVEGIKESYVLESMRKIGHSSPDVVIQELLQKKDDSGNPFYDLVYVQGCNEDNVTIRKGNATQPVILHSEINHPMSAKAKII